MAWFGRSPYLVKHPNNFPEMRAAFATRAVIRFIARGLTRVQSC